MTGPARPALPPEVAGPALGLLNVASMATSGHPLGVTTAFEDAAALLARRVAPDAMRINAYLQARDDLPRVGWEWALIAGLALGSRASAMAGGARAPVAPRRADRRTDRRTDPGRGDLAAFVGGALLMFGARCAGGCTSGHGLSGTAQLALSSWTFMPLAFGVGAAVARAMHGRGGAR